MSHNRAISAKEAKHYRQLKDYKKASYEEKKTAILTTIATRQPKRLLHLLQSQIDPNESKTIVRSLRPSPLVDLVKEYIACDTDDRRKSLELIWRILISYNAIITGANVEFKKRHRMMLESKKTQDKYIQISNSTLSRINDHGDNGSYSSFSLPEIFYDSAIIPFFNNKQSAQSFVYSHVLPSKNKDMSKLKKLIETLILFNETFLSEESSLEKLKLFINNYDKYLDMEQEWNHEIRLYPYLSECACASGTFNRQLNQRRQNLERLILEETSMVFPCNELIDFHILSIGSGRLLQDFILICKFILLGYKRLHITFVEPDMDNDALIQFKSLIFFAANNGLILTVNHYKSMNEYSEQADNRVKMNLIYAIDFDAASKALDDLMAAHTLLAEEGRFYLSFHGYDLCFTKYECVMNQVHDNSVSDTFREIELFKEMIKAKKSEKVIAYSSIGHADYLEWTQFIPLLSMFNFHEINFTFLQPKKKNYFNIPLDDNNNHITPDCLSYFLKLFLPKMRITVKFSTSLSSYDNPMNTDIATMIDLYPQNNDDKQFIDDAYTQQVVSISLSTTKINEKKYVKLVNQYFGLFTKFESDCADEKAYKKQTLQV